MRVPWLANPAVWFVINQLRMMTGTFFFLECDQKSEDVIYLFAMLSVFIFFIIGAGMAKVISSFSAKFINRWSALPVYVESGHVFNILLIILIILSVSVSALYFYAIGYNLFLLGVYSIITGQGGLEDPSTMRLYAYSLDTYFAPGYVNQFKNTLLPLLVTYVTIRAALLGRRRKLIAAAMLLTPVLIVFLLGTGQRGAFILAAFCFIIFLLTVFQRLKRRYIVLPLLAIVFLFMLSSLIIGHGANELKDVNDFGNLLAELPNRLVSVNQSEGVITFRYIYSKPTTWGAEWLADIKQLIPNLKDQSYIPTAHLNFELLYGSIRGTSPLTLVASLWFNFHIVGITLLPFLLGVIYQTVYYRLVTGPKTLFRLAIFSTLAPVLGFWGGGGNNSIAECWSWCYCSIIHSRKVGTTAG